DGTVGRRTRRYPRSLPLHVAGIAVAVRQRIRRAGSRRVALVEEDVKAGPARHDHVDAAIAVQVGGAEAHADSDDIVWRRLLAAGPEVWLQITVREHVPLEAAIEELVIEEED